MSSLPPPKPPPGGCEGGTIDLAFDYGMKKGVYLEADYAYEARDGACRLNRTGLQPVATLDGFVDLPENDYEVGGAEEGSWGGAWECGCEKGAASHPLFVSGLTRVLLPPPQATMQAVARQPIPVNLDASAFAFYSSGVFDETHCGTGGSDVPSICFVYRGDWACAWGGATEDDDDTLCRRDAFDCNTLEEELTCVFYLLCMQISITWCSSWVMALRRRVATSTS
jgi:hypothetical protein